MDSEEQAQPLGEPQFSPLLRAVTHSIVKLSPVMIANTAIIVAVFLPVTFMEGIPGQFFRVSLTLCNLAPMLIGVQPGWLIPRQSAVPINLLNCLRI